MNICNHNPAAETTSFITASSVDETHIVFKCPCPKKCKTKYHRHGSEGNLLNRCTHRSSHCVELDDYYLVINNDTLRATQKNNGYVYKKSMLPLKYIYDKQLAYQNSKTHKGTPLTKDGKLNIIVTKKQ